MDSRQKQTVARYAELLKSGDVDLAVSVGRNSTHLGVAEKIWADISTKLKFKKEDTLLDVGCGFGELTEYCMGVANKLNMSLHLVDIPEALEKIKTQMSHQVPEKTKFWSGVFPDVMNLANFPKQADLILVYSVLHYTDHPEAFIEKAVSLLSEGGQLLLGDLPNVHKKGRFLSSTTGRIFEADYRKTTVNDIPLYKDQFDFFKRDVSQNKSINDNLIANTVTKYRAAGYHVYMLPQADGLPFCKTREDVLIVRP